MNPLQSLISRRNQHREDSPLSLWNEIFLLAVGFFSLGVCLSGLLVDIGPRFVAGTHIEKTPLVSYVLIGLLALFFIVEGYVRIDRAIQQVSERLKETSVLN